jgi:hypothetical protein
LQKLLVKGTNSLYHHAQKTNGMVLATPCREMFPMRLRVHRG